MNIKKDDMVKVITGRDRGKTGRVIKVFPKKNRLIVEGLNLVKKHQRPTQENQQGGIVEKELSIHSSNVMFLHKSKPIKVGFNILKYNKKVRINKPLDGSCAKVCTEFKIPDLTRKVPVTLIVKVRILKTITQE